MNSTKQKVKSMLNKLPDDCSIEDIQYHLYVLEKVRQGIATSAPKDKIPQEEVEGLLSKWLIE
ncbi:MAG: hypothetical protein DSM107014_12695 [Gomphosphaeria aponina SAG 52.96 = DSM 107014]|uniref:Uncharacterized protein n=1 Tax=Gomphosphaeria aponina SAG 52.96 = DSM 107014 TaxID=1521640 RepID=A0A941GUM5_9CHRO|nr:hypothetical protein [Gomphosphaeria aponina SAG 52.96 = DSM 107014]